MAIDALSRGLAANPLQGFRIADLVASKFDEGDVNKDGKFSIEEYKSAQEQSGFAKAISAGGVTAEEIFARLDADQDGEVSKDEFVQSHGEGVVSATVITLGLPQTFANKFAPENITALLSAQENRDLNLLNRLQEGASRLNNSSNNIADALRVKASG